MSLNPLPDFWQSKRVLVTGHTGFKGSWISLWLSHLGADVIGVALEPHTEPNIYRLAALADIVDSRVLDIRDAQAVYDVVEETRPDIVIHLAAQSLVRLSYDDPIGTYATNVMGTVHLLDAVRRVGGTRAFINVTSDKCYENFEWPWPYRETDQVGGRDPYSNSKGCAELVTMAFRRSFFGGGDSCTALASVRAGNVIGGGDWATDRLLPDCIRAISIGRPVQIRNPDAVRPWQHVLEPLTGYLLLAEQSCAEPAKFSEAWNFGPVMEDARPVRWIVDRMISQWGDDASWELQPDGHLHEATELRVDSSKAQTYLGWRPRLDIGAAIDWTVEWYRGHLSGMDARALCLDQIDRYQELGTGA